MSKVLHDYKCNEHGFFEAYEAICPVCGSTEVQMVFLQPVGTMSDRTKGSDKTINQLAQDFKMSDIKSVREGEAQPPRFANQQNPFAPRWGNPGDLGGFNLRSVAGENVSGLNAVKDSNKLSGPKIGSFIADHQNLQIKK
ncbi:MAG: FmdB family zinc ribbon protein [Candidatus Nanopelagicaceae bacterium]